MDPIVIPPERWVHKKNANQPDSVFLDGVLLPSKLLGLAQRPRGTAPGETVAHCADGSPVPDGYDASTMMFSGINLSPDGKWKYVFVPSPEGVEAMILADSELPPEEQKLTGLERAALAVFIAQSEPWPEEWDE